MFNANRLDVKGHVSTVIAGGDNAIATAIPSVIAIARSRSQRECDDRAIATRDRDRVCDRDRIIRSHVVDTEWQVDQHCVYSCRTQHWLHPLTPFPAVGLPAFVYVRPQQQCSQYCCHCEGKPRHFSRARHFDVQTLTCFGISAPVADRYGRDVGDIP